MTDLRSPRTSRRRPAQSPDDPVGRPLGLAAAFAGAVAAGAVLTGCMALGLVGWFASDAGGHGDTRDALRVGADGWLLAHGARLTLEAATISVVPLGLTLLCGYVLFRLGSWAGETSAVPDWRTVAMGAVVLAGVYAVVATVTAVLASLDRAQPSLVLAFVGGLLLAFVAGGAGIASGSGQLSLWRTLAPESAVAVTAGVASVVLLMLAAGSALVAATLLADFGSAANVLSRLHPGLAGGLLYTLVVAAVVPNAVLLGGAYLVGPGFMVGTGTVVSPTSVVLGPVPAFPLVAALPEDRQTPWWTLLLIAVPVLVAVTASALMTRRYPPARLDVGAMRGLSAGLLGGVVFGLLTALAGGSAGPGRMADIGALLSETVVAAAVAMGVGGLVGGLSMSWWLRRRQPGAAGPVSVEKTEST